MGLAASQARLLTITARLADNELRSQTINNAKMRLATQSAQASDEYVSALNNAQMMFSNVGADGLTQNQALTYRALTQYSPYNTQYGLVNSAGQILVSEEEAKIFSENRDNLEGFLEAHGLEWDTTFFDEDVVGKMAPKLASFYSDKSNIYIGNLFADMTNEQLKAIYMDSLSQEASVEKLNYRKSAQNLSRQKDSIYEKVIAPFRNDVIGKYGISEEDILKYVENPSNIPNAKELQEYLINQGSTRAGAPAGNYNVTNPDVVQPYIIEDVPGTDRNKVAEEKGSTNWHDTTQNKLADIARNCRDSITPGANTAGCMSGFDTCESKTTANITYTVKDTDPNTGKEIDVPHTASYDYYDFPSIGIKFVFGYPKAADTHDKSDVETKLNYVTITNPGNVEFISGAPNRDGNRMYIQWDLESFEALEKDSEAVNDNVMKYLKGPTDKNINRYYEYHYLPNKNGDPQDWIYIIPITVGVDKNQVYKDVTNQYLDALLGTEGYMDLIKYAEKNPNIAGLDDFNEAFNDFKRYYDIDQTYQQTFTRKGSDGQILTDENGNPKVDTVKTKAFDIDHDTKSLLKFEEFLKLTNANDTPKSQALTDITFDSAKPAMKSVLGSYMADMMCEVLGEPKFSWADKNDPNNTGNADAKAQWYTNLFNRMQKGFKVLENGLAKSPEWIEYAFETGLVTMEQVDLSFNWNALDYKSCSNIFEETDNSQTVSKAEAKYNRAMNDIKQKDSIFDLQLKNIDTEHSALQTEYDVIKNVMNKNIERTMKFDQNG